MFSVRAKENSYRRELVIVFMFWTYVVQLATVTAFQDEEVDDWLLGGGDGHSTCVPFPPFKPVMIRVWRKLIVKPDQNPSLSRTDQTGLQYSAHVKGGGRGCRFLESFWVYGFMEEMLSCHFLSTCYRFLVSLVPTFQRTQRMVILMSLALLLVTLLVPFARSQRLVRKWVSAYIGVVDHPTID